VINHLIPESVTFPPSPSRVLIRVSSLQCRSDRRDQGFYHMQCIRGCATHHTTCKCHYCATCPVLADGEVRTSAGAQLRSYPDTTSWCPSIWLAIAAVRGDRVLHLDVQQRLVYSSATFLPSPAIGKAAYVPAYLPALSPSSPSSCLP